MARMTVSHYWHESQRNQGQFLPTWRAGQQAASPPHKPVLQFHPHRTPPHFPLKSMLMEKRLYETGALLQ